MNRIGNKSGSVLILLAVLVILLHSAIPHHHHFDSNSNHKCNSSTLQTRGESPSKTNKYCHGLNNIVFTRINAINVNSNTEAFAILFITTAFNLVKIFNRVLFTTSPTKDIVILKQYLATALSFRGPPALV